MCLEEMKENRLQQERMFNKVNVDLQWNMFYGVLLQ